MYYVNEIKDNDPIDTLINSNGDWEEIHVIRI